jgi:uncharacterized protein YndB with AHSA1/START domain
MPKPRHVHEVYIRTTPERLWQALTDPELTKGYFEGYGVSSAWEPGAPYAYSSDDGPAIVGEVVESEPPRRLVMTFTFVADPALATEAPSQVEWDIEPVGELCRLTLTHGDFGGLSRTWARMAEAWVGIVSGLKTLLETGEPLGPVPETSASLEETDIDAEWHRSLGIDAHMEVWALLGRDDRSPADDEAMLRAAYASAYHWSRAARRTEANESRGEWMISHVLAVLDRPDGAQHHAELSMAVVESAGLTDFDLAYAHEALARAAACGGRLDDAARERAAAAAVPIADDEDRKIFLGDLEAEPWYGLAPLKD